MAGQELGGRPSERRQAEVFGRKVDSRERQEVLQLLVLWTQGLESVDAATDAMRLTVVQQPMGMQSEQFEQARLVAIEVVNQVQTQTSNLRFWPILSDAKGTKMMVDLQMKLNEAHAHQFNLLNLYGYMADAFRRGREDQAPSTKEIASANTAFARVLDDMGKSPAILRGTTIYRHKSISASLGNSSGQPNVHHQRRPAPDSPLRRPESGAQWP